MPTHYLRMDPQPYEGTGVSLSPLAVLATREPPVMPGDPYGGGMVQSVGPERVADVTDEGAEGAIIHHGEQQYEVHSQCTFAYVSFGEIVGPDGMTASEDFATNWPGDLRSDWAWKIVTT